MPFLTLPQDLKNLLEAPLPTPMQQLHGFAWLLGPLICFALGSYCLDSKNSLCLFPGTPYFYRVLMGNITRDNTKDKSHLEIKKNLKIIRDWAMAQNPAENTSSHYWYKSLTGSAMEAFDRVAQSSRISDMFATIFLSRHYKYEILTGMNEIYVTGPSRQEEVANSDHVFYTRHVDGPFGLIPFVSVYRCIVGLDKNMMVSIKSSLNDLQSV